MRPQGRFAAGERGPPANLDAEEGLLACCMADGPGGLDAVGKATAMGAAPEWFYRPQNGIIWAAMVACYAAGGEADDFAVAGELERRGQLALAGGLGDLNRIACRVETASGWHRYAAEVKGKALARRAITEATRLAERLASGDDLTIALAGAEDALGAIAGEAGETGTGPRRNPLRERQVAELLSVARPFAFDISHRPERRPPIISLAGFPVCKKGDLMAFMAPNKSGKSSAIAAMLAATFSAPGADCLGFEAANPDGEGVLHLMTEESVEDHDDMIRRSLRRARIEAPPTWFHSYHLRRFDTAKRRQFIFAKANEMAKERPVRLIVLDGFSDFVEDVNDNKECKAFADELLANIDALNCSIAGTIHVNPSLKHTERDKAMGHLGSIIERKASSILLLKKEIKEGVGEIITINTKDARKGKGDAPPRFVWSEECQMHVRYVGPTDIVNTVRNNGRPKQWTWAKVSTYIVAGMPDLADWQQSDIAAIAGRAGCSPDTVRRIAAKRLAEIATGMEGNPLE